MRQGFREKAGDKTRTCDRLITNQLLYQLSYTSKSTLKYNGLAVLWAGGCATVPHLETAGRHPAGEVSQVLS